MKTKKKKFIKHKKSLNNKFEKKMNIKKGGTFSEVQNFLDNLQPRLSEVERKHALYQNPRSMKRTFSHEIINRKLYRSSSISRSGLNKNFEGINRITFSEWAEHYEIVKQKSVELPHANIDYSADPDPMTIAVTNCHGCISSHAFQIPEDMKIITFNSIGTSCYTGSQVCRWRKSQYGLFNQLLNGEYCNDYSIRDYPTWAARNLREKPHIYFGKDIIIDIKLNFTFDIIRHIGDNRSKPSYTVQDEYQKPGIITLYDSDQQPPELFSDQQTWLESEVLKIKNPDEYDKLKKDLYGKSILLSELIPILQKFGINIIFLPTCRNWCNKKDALNEMHKIKQSYFCNSFFNRLLNSTFISDDIEKYKRIGEFKDDKLNGLGKITILDDDGLIICEGEFKNGQLNGIGKTTNLDNGDIYEGEFINGQLNGLGKVIILVDNELEIICEGEFINGQLNGLGKITNQEDGDIYEGQFKNGALNGPGKIIWHDGRIDEGEFKDDRLNGLGTRIYKSGITEEGLFKNGELNGVGKIIDAHGTLKKGEFIDGILNGRGIMIFEGWQTHEGIFKNGVLNGPGKIIWHDGRIVEGVFRDGELNEGK